MKCIHDLYSIIYLYDNDEHDEITRNVASIAKKKVEHVRNL